MTTETGGQICCLETNGPFLKCKFPLPNEKMLRMHSVRNQQSAKQIAEQHATRIFLIKSAGDFFKKMNRTGALGSSQATELLTKGKTSHHLINQMP
jgi:hypothetical protein